MAWTNWSLRLDHPRDPRAAAAAAGGRLLEQRRTAPAVPRLSGGGRVGVGATALAEAAGPATRAQHARRRQQQEGRGGDK